MAAEKRPSWLKRAAQDSSLAAYGSARALDKLAGRARSHPSVEATDWLGPAFLCHSSIDKSAVRRLHQRLAGDHIKCWFDEESLIPGQDWDLEIRRAIKDVRFVLACLSDGSLMREGYVHRELGFALDRALERPEGSIFIIPVRLEPCVLPDRLQRLHCVDLYLDEGYANLLRALRYAPTAD
jgi:hypothetical protein